MMRIALCLVLLGITAAAEERTEYFDQDPHWDGLNNRGEGTERRHVVQDFGYDPKRAIGGTQGAIGGTVCPDGTPAYYAAATSPLDLSTPFSARGKIVVEPGAGNTLLGFFNSKTINEWRTPNAIVFRINGRGDFFHVHVEYATAKWRAGAGVIGRYDKEADRMYPVEIPSTGVHSWSLSYDPRGNNGTGRITATFDDMSAVCDLDPGFIADDATFDQFGLLNVVKHADGGGNLWIGGLEVNNKPVDLASDPNWLALNNHADYLSDETRPRFNVGYSATQYAGGKAVGEIGGLFFRGDCRDPHRLGYYGAKLGPLTLAKPIKASGKVALRRAVSDSTTLFGFFNAEHSVKVNDAQNQALPMDYLGLSIEGPSAQGFYVYPTYRVHGDGAGGGEYAGAPRIYPDGATHDWTLEYTPSTSGGATLTVTLDKVPSTVKLNTEDLVIGSTFDHFGFITPWIDGNGQVVYLDDLTYTEKH